jgi:hypothetical protein
MFGLCLLPSGIFFKYLSLVWFSTSLSRPPLSLHHLTLLTPFRFKAYFFLPLFSQLLLSISAFSTLLFTPLHSFYSSPNRFLFSTSSTPLLFLHPPPSFHFLSAASFFTFSTLLPFVSILHTVAFFYILHNASLSTSSALLCFLFFIHSPH